MNKTLQQIIDNSTLLSTQIVQHIEYGGRYEYIKWVNGFRNLWERITKEEYESAKLSK